MLRSTLLVLAVLATQVPPPPEGAPTTPALRRLLESNGVVERVATNFQFADGPVWIDGALVFTDAPRGQVLRWRAGEEPAVIAEESGGASGLALDASSRLVAAESRRRRVSRREDGEVATVLDRVGGGALNGPTDVAVAPDGALYIVDAPAAGDRTGLAGRIVRVPSSGGAEVVIEGLNRPTGLAVAPDGSELYVADAGRRDLRAYRSARARLLGRLESSRPSCRGSAASPGEPTASQSIMPAGCTLQVLAGSGYSIGTAAASA